MDLITPADATPMLFAETAARSLGRAQRRIQGCPTEPSRAAPEDAAADVVHAPTAGLFLHLGFDLVNPWIPAATPVVRPLIDHALQFWPGRSTPFSGSHDEWTPQDHLERIAYLVTHWEGPTTKPLLIEVDEYGTASIDDGCHRLTAAWYRREATVPLALSGHVDEWPALLTLLDALAAEPDLPAPVGLTLGGI